MAWAEKLTSGRYRGVYRDALGRQRSAGTFPHKARAEREAAAREVAARRALGRAGDAHKQTWGDWSQVWLAGRDVEGSTRATDESRRRRHLEPRWGNVPLGAITRHDVKAWAVELTRAGMGPETVKRCVHLLSASLAAAVDEGVIDANPAARLRLRGGEQAGERYLTRGEFDAILEQLPTSHDQLIASMLVYTGMRWGELAGHHRNRLDLDRGLLRVVETYDEKTNRIKPYPKGRRVRDVPLLPGLVDQLRELEPAVVACPVPHQTGRCRAPLTLTSVEGAVLRNSNWASRVWRPAAEFAGVGEVRVHDLRHTFASWLLQGGRPLAEVGKLLGHVSPLSTQRYAHLAREYDAAVLAVLAGDGPAPRMPHESQVADLGAARNAR